MWQLLDRVALATGPTPETATLKAEVRGRSRVWSNTKSDTKRTDTYTLQPATAKAHATCLSKGLAAKPCTTGANAAFNHQSSSWMTC